MLERIGQAFEAFVRRFMPDPFVLAILLTFLAFILALVFTPHSVKELLNFWLYGPNPKSGF